MSTTKRIKIVKLIADIARGATSARFSLSPPNDAILFRSGQGIEFTLLNYREQVFKVTQLPTLDDLPRFSEAFDELESILWAEGYYSEDPDKENHKLCLKPDDAFSKSADFFKRNVEFFKRERELHREELKELPPASRTDEHFINHKNNKEITP